MVATSPRRVSEAMAVKGGEPSHRLVASPCCLPGLSRAELFPVYRNLGFGKYEAFADWAQARHDWTGESRKDRAEADEHGLAITSFHLPAITDDVEASFQRALTAARYASGLGAQIVLLKARRKELFSQVGTRFLDAVEKEGWGFTTVLQNHKGSAITTIEDYREVFAALHHDPRLKAILEVGHFQRAGISWRDGWDFLGDRVALIHLNDIRAGKSVAYGTGEVDMGGLMGEIKRRNYTGDIVVELELESNRSDPPATIEGLRFAIEHLHRLYQES